MSQYQTYKVCSSKDTIKKSERQPKNGRKYLQITLSDRRLIFRIYKEFLHSDKKSNNPIKNSAKDLNRHFSKDNILIENKV